MTEIRCSYCHKPTGAHFVGGDPYLPTIICTPCADRDLIDEARFMTALRGPEETP